MSFVSYILRLINVIYNLHHKKDKSWKEEVREFGKLISKKNYKKYEGNIIDAEKIMITIDKIYRSDKKKYNFIKKNKWN